MSELINKILDKFKLSGIPSLPELLLHELDMLQSGSGGAASHEKAVELADTDLFLGARLLAHSGAITSRDTSLTDSVSRETLAAIIRQSAASTCFAKLPAQRLRFLKQLYLQSVLACGIARHLADRVFPESPDRTLLVRQAALSGLFLNIGALILDQVFPTRYLELLQQSANTRELLVAEVKEFGIDHAQLGAALMQRWGVEDFCCDAVRYHHHPIAEILDATPLVKIAWMANQLTDERENPEMEVWAQSLFALQASSLASVREKAAGSLKDISQAANIAFTTTSYLPLPEHEDENVLKQERSALLSLRDRIEADNQLRAVSNALAAADNPEAFSAALGFAVRLFYTPCEALLFRLNAQDGALHCMTATGADIKPSQLTIRCEAQRSVIADCSLRSKPLFRLPMEGITVIDRQISALLGADNFCCEPLCNPDTGSAIGVLVLGLPLHQSETYKKQTYLRKALRRELGAILSGQEQSETTQNDVASEYEKRIGETIHEVNNPLGIIKNYLQLLSMKQDGDARMQSEISFIKSEIDRVGIILEKLKAASDQDSDNQSVNINKVVTSLAGLFRGSFGSDKNVSIDTRLDKSLPDIACSEGVVRQIITNLVKNAAEALANGGTITIKTAGNIYMNGERYIQLSVMDNGPGIAPDILDNLFASGHSTKGSGHSGSGLAIVRNLVKKLRGQIFCQTNTPHNNDSNENKDTCGTEFNVLLPVTISTMTAGE